MQKHRSRSILEGGWTGRKPDVAHCGWFDLRRACGTRVEASRPWLSEGEKSFFLAPFEGARSRQADVSEERKHPLAKPRHDGSFIWPRRPRSPSWEDIYGEVVWKLDEGRCRENNGLDLGTGAFARPRVLGSHSSGQYTRRMLLRV